MGRRSGRVYKHSQRNWPYSSPIMKICIPTRSVNKAPYATILISIASPDNIVQTKPLSVLDATIKLDTAVNIDDES